MKVKFSATFAAIVAIWIFAPQAMAQFTAHCGCRLATDQGGSLAHLDNYIKDFGTVATYHGAMPQDQTNQNSCAVTCGNAISTYMNVKANSCHAFLAAGGANVLQYSYVGTNNWTDGGVMQPASYGYPQTCFGPTGYAYPSYYILAIVYAPPGCTSSSTGYKCSPYSYVSYGSTSAIGTTTSTEDSFASGETVTATAGAPTAASASLSGGFSVTNTSGSSVTIQHGVSTNIQWPNPGPVSGDGIFHDNNVFKVLLNPSVAISTWSDSATGNNYAKWTMGIHGPSAKPQDVQVSYLRCALAGRGPGPGGPYNPALYDPSGSCDTNTALRMPGPLNASSATGFLPGLTNADYVVMLNQDMFWNASPTHPIVIPAIRFTQTTSDLPYDPPMGAGNTCMSNTQQQTLSNSQTLSTAVENQYKVSMTFTGGSPGVFNLKSQTDLTWTNKSSSAATNSTTQSAGAVVMCASAGWQGPFFVSAYYDNLYGTYMFTLDDGSGEAKMLEGKVVDLSSKGVPGEPLTLVTGGTTYHTLTHYDGTFTFFSRRSEPNRLSSGGIVSAGGVTQSVSLGPKAIARIQINKASPNVKPGPAQLAPASKVVSR